MGRQEQICVSYISLSSLHQNFSFPRYFTGVEKSRIGETHFYRVSLFNLDRDAVCLTCHLNKTVLEPCQNAKVLLSDDSSRYLLHCLGPSIPYTAAFNLSLNSLISILDTNDHIHAFLRGRDIAHQQILSIVPGETGSLVRVKLMVPSSIINKEGDKTALMVILASEMQQVDNR